MSRVVPTAALVAAAALGLFVVVPGIVFERAGGSVSPAYVEAPCGGSTRDASPQEAGTSPVSAAPATGPRADADALRAAGALLRRGAAVFVENVGQADPAARFVARGGGLVGAFAADALWFQLVDVAPGPDGRPAPVRAARLALRLVDADPSVVVRGEEPASLPVSYFGGRAAGSAPAFARLRYAGVRPGVDLVVRGDDGSLHYDVHVAPGADLDAVRFAVEGASALRVTDDGALVASTAAGEFRQGAPRSFELDADGTRRPLASRFVLRGAKEFGFAVEGRTPDRALVVDPVLSYASYLGGSGFDVAYGITSAGFSEAYVVGATTSTDFPLTAGAVDPVAAGQDAFVVRVNFNGSALLGATYLGGAAADAAYDVAVGVDGTVYVCGDTSSADFPTTSGAFDTTYGGGGDGFLARLAPGLDGLYFSTFLGGAGADRLRGVELAGGGPATAGTSDGAFPATPGALHTAPAGDDVVFAQLTPAGDALFVAGRLGGAAADVAQAFALDPATGEFVFAGGTRSTDWPTTSGVAQPTPLGPPNSQNGFVARVAADGATLAWSTYLGGSADDVAYGVATDGFGATFVGGATASVDFPATPGAFATSLAGPSDGFLVHLDAFGAAVAATYLGGGGDDAVYAVTIDLTGGPQAAGSTASVDFPATFDGFQPTAAGGRDGFFAKVEPFLSTVDHASFLGGLGDDDAFAIHADPRGGTFVAGGVLADFPASSGAFDQSAGGLGDAFVFATVFCYAKPSVSDLGGACAPGPVKPHLDSTNALLAQFFTVSVADAAPGAQIDLWFSLVPAAPLGFGPCTLHLDPFSLVFAGSYFADGAGGASAVFHVTPDSFCCGLELVFQAVVFDPAGLALSNGVRLSIGA